MQAIAAASVVVPSNSAKQTVKKSLLCEAGAGGRGRLRGGVGGGVCLGHTYPPEGDSIPPVETAPMTNDDVLATGYEKRPPKFIRCAQCATEKSVDEFWGDRTRKSGRSRFCKMCEADRRKVRARTFRDTQWQARRRFVVVTQERINELKAQPCRDCGGTFPAVCMDFDHRDPSAKKFNISQWKAHGWDAFDIVEEIAKCDVVCSNCHRVRTFGPKAAEAAITEDDT